METNVLKIIVLVCAVSKTETANVGGSCDQTKKCTPGIETCSAGICNCSPGYINFGGICELSYLTVITGANVTGRFAGSVTIGCTVTGPKVIKIQWIKYIHNVPVKISIDGIKYSGGSVSYPTLIINNLTNQDAAQYQCAAFNQAGVYLSANRATVTVNLFILVNISIPSNYFVYGSDVTLTSTMVSEVPVSTIKWQRMSSMGTFTNLDLSKHKYLQTNVGSDIVTLTIIGLTFQDEGIYRVQVNNSAGIKNSSNQIPLKLTGGQLSVTTDTNITGRFAGSITINCTVKGPEVNIIWWIKYIKYSPTNITVDGVKYSGGRTSSPALIINNLTNNDAAQYQCAAANPGGNYKSANRATVTVMYGQFNEDCNGFCDQSKSLTCIDNKCLCMKYYYHKDQECQASIWLGTSFSVNITTSAFIFFWTCPHVNYDLISSYEVIWWMPNSSIESSGRLDKALKNYTVSSGLISGQLYTLNVLTHANLTDPPATTVIHSNNQTVRLIPLPPGPILTDQSYFAHDYLRIKWTAPANTIFNRYELKINGTTYNTTSNVFIHINGTFFTPGKNYLVQIRTVSGSTIVRKSLERKYWIRITPTKPDPPTNVRCPQSPLDVSLEISWSAPYNSNGLIFQYIIDVNTWNQKTIHTSSNATNVTVGGLRPGSNYTFTVRTVNDAEESIRVSYRSQAVTCKTKAGVPSPPTNLLIRDVQSRRFQITFSAPYNINGEMVGYKIRLLHHQDCLQLIIVSNNCFQCMNTSGCLKSIFHHINEMDSSVSLTLMNLNPFTHYIVQVTAVNGENEGHPINGSTVTDEEIPQKPGGLTASDIYSNQLTLSWALLDPSPGNTTYTINVYEATGERGTEFIFTKFLKAFGFDSKTVSVTGLEEHWSYKFKVIAATGKGNTASDFSSTFRTKSGRPGKVLDLHVTTYAIYKDYERAYVTWRLPDLKDHNGILQNYRYSTNQTGVLESEYIPVNMILQTVQRNFSVIPSNFYFIQVSLINSENMISPPSIVIYEAPGPTYMYSRSEVGEKNNAALITGSVIGVSLVIIGAIVSFCLWKRNKTKEKEQSSNYTDLCLEDISNSDQTYSSLKNDQTRVQNRPVSFHMFCDHVMDLMNNNRQKLIKEYQDLQDSMESPSPATAKENLSNDNAYNFSRVKLPNGKGDINKACSPLNQYYILIQHPELKRIDKFWQMVWEQKVSTITVLTDQMYTNKQWYFPEKDGTICSIGNIKVQVHSTFRASETLVMRKIKLSRRRHSQTVNHFHVSNLDFEKLPGQILALLNLVSQNKISTGPQVIHGGGSGIDYSYVYIAVSYLINLISSGRNEVDVYGTFYTMIKETDFLTNSVEDYAAIYLSLKNYIQNSTASHKEGESIYEVLP